MSTPGFFDGFDEGTLKKLEIVRHYAREWLPVFLAAQSPFVKRVCVFEFFAGPGHDSEGRPGSPLILLEELRDCTRNPGSGVAVEVHLSDRKRENIERLRRVISERGFTLPPRSTVEVLDFEDAFERARPMLLDDRSAKLVLMDQFGVASITREVFLQLVESPRCDFLFFISSSTLHRFREHPAIKHKLGPVSDYHWIHRHVLDYYRGFLPAGVEYYLAPFSFKKGANIYGLVFGSGHPLGIDKFLRIAWSQDETTGEADFDIDREGIRDATSLFLPFVDNRASKVRAFEDELEAAFRARSLRNEVDVLELCFDAGFRGCHVEGTIKRLKREGLIRCSFRVPQVTRWRRPRPIEYPSG